ncbi:hypothetical protein QBC46DRAFT_455861 [Diplogelasinospora grovesii]|uniref:DNA polymerase delta subunit 3 n=1 Tax=Diplogelasinospora grovesii TaxID=303347 RepID=A0AAN6NGN4_9PEZI|nr:hypothetical protein QBC46DRAFT_455861 [Diplogelasinospora grovesii]
MEVYRKYLAENVLHEDKVVTYRLLSRALEVHVNTAKQMLFDFHRTENQKRPGSVHATYLVYGIRRSDRTSSQQSEDGDIDMMNVPPNGEALSETVPTSTLTLVEEGDLPTVLAEYEEVSSIHVYSIGPHVSKDMELLSEVAREALNLGAGKDAAAERKLRGPIFNPRAKRRERKEALAQKKAEAKPVTAAFLKSAGAEPKVKEEPKPAPTKAKEEEKIAQPASDTEKKAVLPAAKKPTPALKRGGSSSSSIMQAFSKTKPPTKAKKAETSQPATPSGDDSHPMSDDGEDDSAEMPQPKAPENPGRKSKREREEELRRMMEEDDDDEEEEEKAESPAPEEEPEEPAAPEPVKEEPAEVVAASGDGRRRGKRKVMRKKQIMDDQGYLAKPSWDMNQEPLASTFDQEACPDYAQYATYPHRPLSEGPLALPYQRPDPRCRTFHSDAIEKVIKDMTARMGEKDPDLARLFENAYPSTTDTTVKFHTNGKDGKGKKKKKKATSPRHDYNGDPYIDPDEGKWEGPQSFIITGDILAEWLRDSTNQLKPYQRLATKDPAIFNLILGAINTQSEYVIEAPYCNAFQPPPISGLPVSMNGQDDVVHPAYEPTAVFECKYELDSLAHFLALTNDFHEHTGSKDFLNSRWYLAVETLLRTLGQQSVSTFDSETGRFYGNEYTFQRRTTTGTETLNLMGVGNPLNNATGLIRSAFRPSDDATIFGFFIPANAMMAVELKRTAAILKSTGVKSDTKLASTLENWSKNITEGIWEHGVVNHKKYGDVFAYEVDGYGSALMMDDANYPSLLALPLMGFVSKDNPTYKNTRRMLLGKTGNPYYLEGREFKGIGGPHIGLSNAWPMSLLMQAQTSDDDEEIMECLQLVLNSSKLGLVHESIDVNWSVSYTRSWFAWANGVFAETILDLARRKPHLIFTDSRPYEL